MTTIATIGSRPRHRGFITMDVILSVALTALSLAAFAVGTQVYRRGHEYAEAARAARLAAEYQLQELRAGTHAIGPMGETEWAPSEIEGVEYRTATRSGTGAWQGFILVRVEGRAFATADGWVVVGLSAYVAGEGERP